MPTTSWGPIVYPTALDTFFPLMVDNVDEVIANHPNSLATAVLALENKVGIDNGLMVDTGGLQFDVTGHASNPGTPGSPSLWIGNTSPSQLYFTDDLGTDYNLLSRAVSGIGTGFVCGVALSVGDLVHISAADTLVLADSLLGDIAHGMVVSVYGGGALCDIVYTGREIVNGGWALTAGTTYYLDAAGAFSTTPPMGWTVQQEIGFARNSTTLVFRPTISTT